MNRNETPYSQLKIFCHPEVLEHLVNGTRCNPVYIRIKPTNKCNHNCAYCHYKNSYLQLDEYDPNDEIPKDKIIVEEFVSLDKDKNKTLDFNEFKIFIKKNMAKIINSIPDK